MADPLAELYFALAQGDSEQVGADLVTRAWAAALMGREPGRPSRPPPPISGLASFQSALGQLDRLLNDLGPMDWSRPALRDLDVQGLVGHLIGIERDFADVLEGTRRPAEAGEHIGSTQPAALAQLGRPPAETLQQWRQLVARTLGTLGPQGPHASASYYGITLPLDEVLVVRAFELWLHHEDVRRATRRPLEAPEPAVLARMVALAMQMLHYGLVRAGRLHPRQSVRLVLTGPGGGTWDVPMDGSSVGPLRGHRPDNLVVVDAASFCRVVGNRETLGTTAKAVRGDPDLAADLFVGAAELALD